MKKILLPLFSLFLCSFTYSQKKPLDHSVYDGWQHIGEKLISNDGKWVVYTIDPQEGDNELLIRSADGNYRHSVPRGYNAVITEDNRFVIFKIRPYYKDIRAARIKKSAAGNRSAKTDESPKDSIGIVELGKENTWKRAGVRNFKTPQRSAGWLAYQLEKPVEQPGNPLPEKKPAAVSDKKADSLQQVIDSLQRLLAEPLKKKKQKDEDDEGSRQADLYGDADGDDSGPGAEDAAKDLAVRNLYNGEEVYFYKVLEYYFSKTGDRLLVEQDVNPSDSFSVHQVLLYDLRSGECHSLSRGGNDFRNFAMTDDGRRIAYVAEREAKPRDLQKFYRIWYYQPGMDSAGKLADRFSVGMKLGMTISEYGSLSFSKSGNRLFFGTAPVQPPRDTSFVEFDHPKLDIWNYQDDYLQTVQTFPARLKNDLQQNYLALCDLETGTIRQLASVEIPQVLTTAEGDGDIFFGVTDYGKRIESQWNGYTRKDIYAIEVATGIRKKIRENLFGQVYPSYSGHFIAWYDRTAKNYFSWDGIQTRNITEKIKSPLWNEENDSPDEPNNYGLVKWGEGDRDVYLYDRYDIWKVDPLGTRVPVKLTEGRTRFNQYRYVQTDPDEKFIRDQQAMHYRVFNEKNKFAGIAVADGTAGVPLFITPFGGFSYDVFLKARNADAFLYTKENFSLCPDLYYTGGTRTAATDPATGRQAERLSALNPRQSQYNWGTAELFTWKAYNGKEATGILYKPEDFDPRRKYPVIIYFYEKLSNTLFDYKEPAPIRSAVNVPFFVSRGYLVFMPDIEYKIGHPGQSAYDYIVSGARALVKKGWADSTRLAMQGHSWGGYQAAQVATMTRLFKAVWAGAPVANMTSAYGGIRWESGVSRQFQYEKSQSRIGGTLWEKLPLYLENSPLFHLDKVTAPMVIMANDADGAVPWYQGIELFTAMRRLGKPVWMFNYNGQGHGLTQRQDMRDYQIRMQQFFDWILKGDKPAKWITEGVPAVKKGKDWGLERVDE